MVILFVSEIFTHICTLAAARHSKRTCSSKARGGEAQCAKAAAR